MIISNEPVERIVTDPKELKVEDGMALYEIRNQGEAEFRKQANRIAPGAGNIADLRETVGPYERLRQQGGYDFDLPGMVEDVKNLSDTELERYVSGDLRYGKPEAELFQLAWKKAEQDPRPWFQRSSRIEQLATPATDYTKLAKQFAKRSWGAIRRRPFVSLTGAFAAVFLGYSAFPGKKDDYNTIEGLRHGWFGQHRAENTDFGSGYQGPKNTPPQETEPPWYYRTTDKIFGSKYFGAALLLGIGGLALHRFGSYAIPAFRRQSEAGFDTLIKGWWEGSKALAQTTPGKLVPILAKN